MPPAIEKFGMMYSLPMPSMWTRTARSWIAPNSLSKLDPLPAGVAGNIQIASYSAQISGDLATVIHTDDEQEYYHGQTLLARYLTTETWRREAAAWKLHLIHVFAVLKDPPAISLSPEILQQYAGRYLAGNDLVYLIEWDGKQLMGRRQGAAMKPLMVEVRDVLFISGQPRIRKIFQRDPNEESPGLWIDARVGILFGSATVPVLLRR